MGRGTGNGLQLSIGDIKGQLTIIGKQEKGWRWIAKCSCGEIRKDISAWDWINIPNAFNRCKSCNSLLPEIGKIYGNALVLEQIKDAQGRTKFKCKCICGRQISPKRPGVLLRPEGTGCQSCQAKKRPKQSSEEKLFKEYRNSARGRKFDFDIDLEQFKIMISQNCHYCNSLPSPRKNYDESFVCNGIDRIDNLLGYSLENCVPCCSMCNIAKNNNSYDSFLSWIDKLVLYRKLRK